MASDLEDILMLMADTLKKLEANQKEFNDYIEALTDANHSLSVVHDKLIPIIQDMSGVMSVLPDLITDTNLLSEEIKLYLKNSEKRWIENDIRWEKIKNNINIKNKGEDEDE